MAAFCHRLADYQFGRSGSQRDAITFESAQGQTWSRGVAGSKKKKDSISDECDYQQWQQNFQFAHYGLNVIAVFRSSNPLDPDKPAQARGGKPETVTNAFLKYLDVVPHAQVQWSSDALAPYLSARQSDNPQLVAFLQCGNAVVQTLGTAVISGDISVPAKRPHAIKQGGTCIGRCGRVDSDSWR